MRSPLIVSKKHTGVYHKILLDGDVSFCINYKESGKVKWVTIGKKSEGINEAYCHQQRNDIINKAKFGEQSPIIKHKKKKSIITFDEMATQYIGAKELKQGTEKLYGFYFKYLSPIIGAVPLNELDTDTVNKIKNTLKKDGKSASTINSHVAFIRAVFNHAIEVDLYKGKSPCEKVDLLKIDNNRERYLTIDEVTRLKEAISDNHIITLFVELSLSTGGRLETILSITKKDIDFTQRIITLTNHKKGNTYKGFISDSLLPMLQKRCDEITNPNDLIIKTSSTSKIKPFQVHEIILRDILNKLFNDGLDTKDAKNRVVIHTLRHTFASHLAIKGTPIFTIMKLLDHSDIKHTLRYAKLAPDSGLDAVRGLFQ